MLHTLLIIHSMFNFPLQVLTEMEHLYKLVNTSNVPLSPGSVIYSKLCITNTGKQNALIIYKPTHFSQATDEQTPIKIYSFPYIHLQIKYIP